jgi:D-alanine-D-alanine ligase
MLAQKLDIAVVMGGWAKEREVSLMSGRGVAEALEARGHRVSLIDMGRDLAQRLYEARPDVVFNALHGVPGEDGSVQGLFELMGLAYTHSGLAASVIAIDKQLTKRVLEPHGVPFPDGRVVSREELFAADPMPRPYVLKPLNEGSSVGVAIITEEGNAGKPIAPDAAGPWQEFDLLLAERFVAGHELTTAVIEEDSQIRALGVTELVVRTGFYDYENKYTEGRTEHVYPACIPDEIAALCEQHALAAHRVLGCRGTSRTDFRWDAARGAAGLFALETNTQPGMTPLSLVPEQAARNGIAYEDLVELLVAAALRRSSETAGA